MTIRTCPRCGALVIERSWERAVDEVAYVLPTYRCTRLMCGWEGRRPQWSIITVTDATPRIGGDGGGIPIGRKDNNTDGAA